MSDSSQLLIGTTLMFIGIVALIASLPRKGKKVWFVGIPFLAPGASILMIGTIALGVILIVAYFTAIDDATLAGMAKHL